MFFLKELEVTNLFVLRLEYRILKRFFDLFGSIILLSICIVPIIILIIIGTFDTNLFGLFLQKRIGAKGKEFYMFKIRTINKENKISNLGLFIRINKLDELPQLFNILINNMSFVGARPELPEYFKKHQNYPQKVLRFKPGLTGLASLYFYNEDQLKIISTDQKFEKWMYLRKNTLNKLYIKNQNLCYDVKIMYLTFIKIIGI